MKIAPRMIAMAIAVFLAGLVLGSTLSKVKENFASPSAAYCYSCKKESPCGCSGGNKGEGTRCPPCPACPACPAQPDMSKYVLKATVPPCPPLPDMTKYMLKTECPPYPDMSKYVLKSSVPKCPPCIAGCSKPCKIGDCPPCPRPRCPVVKCPEPKACAPCPVMQPERCPEPQVSCKASFQDAHPVRPMLASTAAFGF